MPAKAKAKVAAKKPSSIQDFKEKARTKVELELPSGAAILAKGVSGMGTFLKSGIIPNSLLGIIQDALTKGTEPDLDELLKPDDNGEVSPEALADMLTLIDNITVKCWVLPPAAIPPEDEAERRDDVLYTDEIDDNDKLFVFQWAIGGSPDLVRFREEQNAGMDRLRASEGMEGNAKLSARS
jgi:hypothetical protein